MKIPPAAAICFCNHNADQKLIDYFSTPTMLGVLATTKAARQNIWAIKPHLTSWLNVTGTVTELSKACGAQGHDWSWRQYSTSVDWYTAGTVNSQEVENAIIQHDLRSAGTLWFKNGQAHFVVSIFETTVDYFKIHILLACYAISFVSNVRFLDVFLVFTIVSSLLLVRISNRSHHVVQFLYNQINRLN